MNPSILYVEDDRFSRKVVKVILNQMMDISNVTIFEDSQDFMERVAELPEVPDVVFLDIQMRPHDGFTVLEMLRANPVYRDTTVVALTANVMAHDVDKLKAVGFDGLIGKPIMGDIFPDLVKRILGGDAIWYIP